MADERVAAEKAEALRSLFKTKDELKHQLAVVDATIAIVGRKYSEAKGYRVPLRVETLKLEVGVKA